MRKYLGILVMLSICLTACGTNKQPNQESTEETKQIKNTKAGREPNSYIDTPSVERKSGEVHQSKDLVKLAENVPGVQKAYVIVSGLYTLVGIQPMTKVQPGQENDELRTEVYNVLKKNAQGRNAAITTDPDKIADIKRLGEKVTQGKRHQTHRGVYNELGHIISKIKPVNGQYKSTERQEMHKDMDKNRDDLYK
ncbi:YhcN/YlaJ family sporulation lipoprotein [Fictibacillus barbaricus]|uniref:YhcN/YlaJ family sporulation lipoprotein n=1 Tax=Fictibacillus barbaricus TaxID=182136 RepID=A0ABU1TYF6_9BACL|nr:YhcN/YlaJ family sporulation lipoprotein [Fictibacillus barbaricus]MDR7072231.1 YhcN/YlaJ family sporulation lipoprotein [Fictibacillus barbaricus]